MKAEPDSPPDQGVKSQVPGLESLKSLPSNNLNHHNLIPIWLIPKEAPLKPISQAEEKIAKSLGAMRSRQFRHSRGYARDVLAYLFGIHPLEIPLNAFPGEPPKLPSGWGYISFSHSKDCFVLGWSQLRIGIDVERNDRCFEATAIVKRHFFQEEKLELAKLKKKN